MHGDQDWDDEERKHKHSHLGVAWYSVLTVCGVVVCLSWLFKC